MRHTPLIALSLTTLVALSACGSGGDPLEAGGEDPGTGTAAEGTSDGAATGEPGSVVVGSANFPENELLAEIYAAALSDQGVEVSTTLNIGSRETYMAGLEDGSIDLIPEYTGGLATFLNPDITATSSEEVLQEAQDTLPEGLQLLEISEAEDKDALVVTRETAEELSLSSISDLEGKAGDLVLGGPPEFETRPNGVEGLREVYGVEFGQFRSLAAGSNLTVQALANGQVDAANIFTTNPAIEENDFVVLEDPESLFAAQNIVPLISQEVVNPTVEDTLNAVSRVLTTENLTAMMVQVASEGQDPETVAREFVDGNL
jgi:osmoprotectant transport system substrate-binding protein